MYDGIMTWKAELIFTTYPVSVGFRWRTQDEYTLAEDADEKRKGKEGPGRTVQAEACDPYHS
jgi:hypothetical protein